jgi:hypothetical protein
VGEVREERREAQQEGLPARGPLGAGAADQVALRQQVPDHGCVEARSRVRRTIRIRMGDINSEAARERVGDPGDGTAQSGGQEGGVQQRPVRAGEEDAPPARGALRPQAQRAAAGRPGRAGQAPRTRRL